MPDIGTGFLTENFYDLMSNGLVYGEVWIEELVSNETWSVAGDEVVGATTLFANGIAVNLKTLLPIYMYI